MAELDTKDREELKDSQYAYVGDDGERKLPIPDEEHVRNAIQRFSQTDFGGDAEGKRGAARKILAAAERHGIDVSEDDDVRKALR
jgi:hypothetical protein